MFRISLHWLELFVLAMAIVTSGCSGSRPALPILVSLSSSTQVVDQSQTVGLTAAVTNDPLSGGVSWSLTGPGFLTNANATSVTYNPPTTSLATAERVTVTASSIADRSKTASAQITVNPYLQIPFQTLANGSVGQPYQQTIAITGGTAPFQWSVYNGPIVTGWRVGGSVPDGLTLNARTGTISGTPTGGGTWYFEGTVTDAAGVTAINGFLSIQINAIPSAANPVPFLNQPLVPTSVSPGSSASTISVSGTEFVSGATIDFNSTPLVTNFVDNEHLTAIVPAADVANARTASVTVVNPAPGGGSSNAVYLQVGASETTVNFASPTNLSLQNHYASGIIAGDFNEDGKPDLAVAAGIWLHIFLGSEDGTFSQASGSPLRAASPPFNDAATPFNGPMVVGDFNHSGHQGLAVGDVTNAAAYILLGKGDGTFAPSSAGFADSHYEDVCEATGDLNADGNLDLAFSAIAALGYGDGAFTPVDGLYDHGFPESVALGDFNGDGKLDVVVANAGSTTYPDSGLVVSLGNGDGKFTSAPDSPIPLGSSLAAVVVADFDGNGKLDLAATDADSNTVMILLGNGDGTFGAPVTISLGNQPQAMVAADFNNDGKLDLVVANYGDNTITLLLGNGDGTFTPSSTYVVGQNPFAIAAADFNGDGKIDLAVVDIVGKVWILLQQ